MWAQVKAVDTHREARNTRPGIVKGIQPSESVGKMCIIPLRGPCDKAKNRRQIPRMGPSPSTVSSLQNPHGMLTTGVLGGACITQLPRFVGRIPAMVPQVRGDTSVRLWPPVWDIRSIPEHSKKLMFCWSGTCVHVGNENFKHLYVATGSEMELIPVVEWCAFRYDTRDMSK